MCLEVLTIDWYRCRTLVPLNLNVIKRLTKGNIEIFGIVVVTDAIGRGEIHATSPCGCSVPRNCPSLHQQTLFVRRLIYATGIRETVTGNC